MNKFNRSLWLSLLVFPFVLTITFLPLYFILFFINMIVLEGYFENQSILTYYVIGIIAIVIINFLYGKIILGHKIKKGKIYKVQERFFIKKKDTYTYTSETVSNSDYFRLYLIGEDKEEKGIYISKEDYKRINEKTSIMLVYFEIVDIPIEGFYEDEKLDFFRFFVVKKMKYFVRQLTYWR
ncbi:hypothetical protein [Elizabethkingia miricola]|uniref:Uncharacterized protein n=1 Tax=Elizabethkingia miricola TaxID=172045 RepID=A0ABD5B7H8_ELIMR|nr:hypothetical protein [Elizabethkingia miricola]MDQ8749870.1 hypothetical protein [Elizabethkingia miricola]